MTGDQWNNDRSDRLESLDRSDDRSERWSIFITSFYAFNFARIVCLISLQYFREDPILRLLSNVLTPDTRLKVTLARLFRIVAPNCRKKNEGYIWQVWSTEGWVGILVASIRGKNDRVQHEKPRVTKLRQELNPPRNPYKKGGLS